MVSFRRGTKAGDRIIRGSPRPTWLADHNAATVFNSVDRLGRSVRLRPDVTCGASAACPLLALGSGGRAAARPHRIAMGLVSATAKVNKPFNYKVRSTSRTY